MKLWIFVLAMGLGPAIAAAADAPPVGKRKYVIDTENKFKPATITKRNQEVKQTYLKDPNLKDLDQHGPLEELLA